MTSGFTPKEQADFFVNNAAKFYRLSANLQTS
jgi:predicted TIM-barrel fold metal-dependent hydrolase